MKEQLRHGQSLVMGDSCKRKDWFDLIFIL